jgi:hypothetical protein
MNQRVFIQMGWNGLVSSSTKCFLGQIVAIFNKKINPMQRKGNFTSYTT